MAPPANVGSTLPPGIAKLLRPPRRAIRPASQRLCRPRRRLVGVTQIAGVVSVCGGLADFSAVRAIDDNRLAGRQIGEPFSLAVHITMAGTDNHPIIGTEVVAAAN